jgi:hypothetical protein
MTTATTWTVTEQRDSGIRIVIQGLTREFAQRVVDGSDSYRSHSVEVTER